jgi:predicted DNA-binding transcriptional regulator YafY
VYAGRGNRLTTKERIIRMIQLFQTQTDEEHQISTLEIIAYFKELGVVTDRKTVKNDIDTLNDCGVEIVTTPGRPNKYFFADRKFELAELKLLVDAVEASKFITAGKSKELVSKIASMTSINSAEELQRYLYTVGRVKSENDNIFYVVDAIFRAIKMERKISFQYFRYDVNRNRVARHDGEPFILSPYAMLYNEDKYYVLGYYTIFDKITIFRVDRMGVPEILDEPIRKKPDDFDPVNYVVNVFSMYDGDAETVELLCENNMMDSVMDRFGDEAQIQEADSDHFKVTAQVSVSQTFFAWVFQFAGHIQLIGPNSVRERYQEMLQNALHLTTGVK